MDLSLKVVPRLKKQYIHVRYPTYGSPGVKEKSLNQFEFVKFDIFKILSNSEQLLRGHMGQADRLCIIDIPWP